MSEDQDRAPVRILHMIGGLEIGGSQTIVLNLYRAIDRTKIQFDFIVDQTRNMELQPELEALGARIFVLPKLSATNLFELRASWDRFFREHGEYRVLHSHVRSYASLYLPIARKHGVKTIIHSHSTSNGTGVQAVVKRILQYPLRYQADYYLGCSREAGKWLFGKRIVSSDRFHVMRNGTDLKKYAYCDATRRRVRAELGLAGQRTFVHVGRLAPPKNHSFLLEVFANWQKIEPNCVLMLVGEGELRPAIQKRVAELGVDGAVMMLGNRSDIPDLLQAADCFLFPSIWEGVPLALIEAQAAGLPCLASSGIPEGDYVTDLVVRLPIDAGTGCWIDQMKRTVYQRRDVQPELVRAGFDIASTAAWMTDLYLALARKG